MRARLLATTVLLTVAPAAASYTNFESSHVHPIALTPSGAKLLAVNTPDAVLEVFAVLPGGGLQHEAAVPVGLEPVSVVARSDGEAWVVNHLSDTVSVVDLAAGLVTRTLPAGDEPTDVAFAAGKAFVSVAQEDRIRVFDLSNLAAAPATIDLAGRKPRALAVSTDGTKVYAVVLFSGNRTTIVGGNEIFGLGAGLDAGRLAALGLNDVSCAGPPSPYPPLPPGVARNPALVDPPNGVPPVGLIVQWDDADQRWEDETGTGWNQCLPYRVADHDLFVIDAATLAVTPVDQLGTTLFDVAVNPADGRIWVPHTEARNLVRFEHPLGVQGHVVDNRLAIVDPGNGHAVSHVDLNAHVDRGSDPATNLAERLASVSQPGMMAWKGDGSAAFLTAIGSRKLFRVDGGCASSACIFGPNRAAPQAVEVGEGPTGVALHEGAGRLYVLNRFDNSITIVDAEALVKLEEIPLHDPSSPTVLDGRRFLYDAILGSGHGDAACSSCHVSGDRDDLAWDLGDPTGEFVSYATAGDNVRFVVPLGGNPVDCPPSLCASHAGFDPQKGPMTTQTLRGMLEPLHWRGDRATMNDFNAAFVGLLGAADVGPVNGKPAGLSATDMERFRQFTLDIDFPPNPHRRVDDTLPNAVVPVRGTPFSGNPAVGATVFDTAPTDAGQPCRACHTHPFGAAGGTRGGVTPVEPTSATTAALFNGDADQSFHSDVKIAHLRNMYEKLGPVFGDHVSAPPLVRSGFGFGHDGSIPDLGTFFSINVFTMSAQQVRDVAAFMHHFPTGTKPAVGRHLTLPQGTPPTGTAQQESLLASLLALGDLASPARHCELVARVSIGGEARSLRYEGGVWRPDSILDGPMSTTALREAADAPISFLCATLDAGTRLGGDRDEDATLDADDCAPADAGAWLVAGEVGGLLVEPGPGTALSWSAVSPVPGPSLRYEVLGGALSALRLDDGHAATGCLATGIDALGWTDPAADPPVGEGRYYLVRGVNSCGAGDAGPGREELDLLDCE